MTTQEYLEQRVTPKHECRMCGRLSQSTRGKKTGLCGPCWLRKPITFWEEFDRDQA